MSGTLTGLLLNAVWAVPTLAYLLWRMDRRRAAWMAEWQAEMRATREEWARRRAEWDEEDRKWNEETAAWNRRQAEMEAERNQLLAEIEASEAESGSMPTPAP